LRGMGLRTRVTFVMAVVVAFAALQGVARAGTVSIEEIPGNPNQGILRFAAAPGETNQVTVELGEGSSGPGLATLLVVDQGSSLQVGAGCSGGGPAGSTATCVVHAPGGTQYEYCGHDCSRPVPGTTWSDRMEIDLGDGDDYFDGR
jgi:hypothetical protein